MHAVVAIILLAFTRSTARAEGTFVDIFSANDTAPDETTYFCIKIPTLVFHEATSTWIALGEGRVDNCDDVGWTDLVIRRSIDGGNSWYAIFILRAADM